MTFSAEAVLNAISKRLDDIESNQAAMTTQQASMLATIDSLKSTVHGASATKQAEPEHPRCTREKPPEPAKPKPRPPMPEHVRRRREAYARHNKSINASHAAMAASHPKHNSGRSVAEREAEHQAKLEQMYGDRDRTIQIARDILTLAGNDDGIVVVVSDDAEHCQSIASAIGRRLPTAVITDDTDTDIVKGILGRVSAGNIGALMTTRTMFPSIGRETIDVVYLASPVRHDEQFLNALCNWLKPLPTKAGVLKLLGRSDVNIRHIRTVVSERLRDRR